MAIIDLVCLKESGRTTTRKAIVSRITFQPKLPVNRLKNSSTLAKNALIGESPGIVKARKCITTKPI